MKSLSKGLHPVLMLLLFFFSPPSYHFGLWYLEKQIHEKSFQSFGKSHIFSFIECLRFLRAMSCWYRWFHGTVWLYQAPCWWETNYSVYLLKFRVSEHGMPCVLEINSNGGLKRGHVKYWPSTTKKAYLHYHNGYGCQTWQSCDLPWGATTHKIIWPFDHVVLRDHDIN